MRVEICSINVDFLRNKKKAMCFLVDEQNPTVYRSMSISLGLLFLFDIGMNSTSESSTLDWL